MTKIMKRLKIGLAVSLGITILHFLSMNTPEWFIGGGRLFDFAKSTSEAYIASFIFYVIVVLLPYKRKKKIAEQDLDIILYRLSFNLSELFKLISRGGSTEIPRDGDIIHTNSIIFNEIQDFSFSEKDISSLFIGSKLMILQDLSAELLFKMLIESINENASRITAFSEYIDDELSVIINCIILSDLIESINNAKTKNMLEKILKTRLDEIKTFYSFYGDLVNYMKVNKYPTSSNELAKNKARTVN